MAKNLFLPLADAVGEEGAKFHAGSRRRRLAAIIKVHRRGFLHHFLFQNQSAYLWRDSRSVMFGQLIGKCDRSAHNANNSSFLHKLPPEIRMQIYEYALGGNTIFFDRHHSTCTDMCHPNRYRCRAHIAEEPTEESGQLSGHDHEQVKEFQDPVESDWERSGDVSLKLLLTCRQIYNEAFLVPFSNNDFGLNSDAIITDDYNRMFFLRDLIPDQIRAISTLHIRGTMRFGYVQLQTKSMSGLRRLKLSFDFNMMAIRDSPDLLMAALEERFDASGASLFVAVNLQAVDITINLTVFFRDVQAIKAQGKEIVEWVESKRVLLLTRPTPVLRTRRAETVVRTRRAETVVSQPTRVSERIRAQREKEKASAE